VACKRGERFPISLSTVTIQNPSRPVGLVVVVVAVVVLLVLELNDVNDSAIMEWSSHCASRTRFLWLVYPNGYQNSGRDITWRVGWLDSFRMQPCWSRSCHSSCVDLPIIPCPNLGRVPMRRTAHACRWKSICLDFLMMIPFLGLFFGIS